MYYSDHELHAAAKERHREMIETAEAVRLASRCKNARGGGQRALVTQLGALLVSIGQKLQEN